MFDTMKIATIIKEARISRDMTQMNLADAMGVSYQAVSNWERGNSMPDISKLEQLCNVLHITIYELLGTEDPQTKTVSRILAKEELPEAEEMAGIAPIVPPEQLKEAFSETAKKRRIDWDTIVQMAPFLDRKTLDEILEDVEPEDYGRIVAMAPFLSRRTLDRLVLQCEEKADTGMIVALAPFLGRETLDRLVLQSEGEMDMGLVGALAPFLGRDILDKLVEKLLEQGDVGNLSHLYPFLGRETMRKLVKKMMDDGDFDSMRDAAVFL